MPTTVNLIFTAAPTTFTVPANVTSLLIEAGGAGGGYKYDDISGGKGGIVTSTIAVTPGLVLNIRIGGGGGGDTVDGGTGLAGYNGGGQAGLTGLYLGRGGGMTDISGVGGILIVAGGGGGGSSNGYGYGGGLGTGAGGDASGNPTVNAFGGNNGGGGSGGGGYTNGQSWYLGGAGGTIFTSYNGAGGGAGYGGGGSGDYGGGGGGSFSSGTSITYSINSSANDALGNGLNGYVNITYSVNPPCFHADTKILTDKGYQAIRQLRQGDLVKTLLHGFVPINMLGHTEMQHNALEERIKDQLYICSPAQYPELNEDLILTGCHSILVKEFKEGEREKTQAVLGKIYVTDDCYRLPACIDERARVYEKKGTYTIYHLALDNDNIFTNYGIYVNGLLDAEGISVAKGLLDAEGISVAKGLLVETCSKRYLLEYSGMTLIN